MSNSGALIAHPTRQHSYRLAQALHQEGGLHSFWTLLPDDFALNWIPEFIVMRLPTASKRNSLGNLPRECIHVLLGPLAVQKISSRFQNQSGLLFGEWLAWSLFDRWVASQIKNQMPHVVVGYEMCCEQTFRAAKSIGATCVLDAAAVHYAFQYSAFWGSRNSQITWAGKLLRARKKAEIELADQIICVSELAKRSYVAAGVDPNKITVNAVGCDTQLFSQAAAPQRIGPIKFIFAGLPATHKGFDLLIKSFEEIAAQTEDVELHIAGDSFLAERFIHSSLKGLKLHGKLSHPQLVDLLCQMDCLVLPSRLESFGMVVVEALAAGVPVIVSDHVGAAEAVKEDKNGWIIPTGNIEALYLRMRACCENIEQVRSMKDTCADSALAYDWSQYSRRCVEIFGPMLKGHAV